MCFISRCIPCLPCFNSYHQQSTVSPIEEVEEPMTYYPVPSSPPRSVPISFQNDQQPTPPPQDEEHLPSVVGSYPARDGHSPSLHHFSDYI